jgi:hypothetical protein
MFHEFDPKVVGELEAGWWKAHNQKDRKLMFQLLVDQHVNFYSLGQGQVGEALGFLLEATKYHDAREWDSAINLVTEYYRVIKLATRLPFDPIEMAELEVGWWKLHDELEAVEDKVPLIEAFAKLYSEQFGLPTHKMLFAGRLKAQATYEHDLAEDPKTNPEEVEGHWIATKELLIEFYEELKKAISD